MFQDAFLKLDRQECETLLEEIAPAIKGGKFSAETVTVLGQEISFYPGYRFLDIADHSLTPPPRRFVIHKPGDVVVLDWTNEPIYALNERAPLVLTEETVVEYARFFFTYIRGRHGRFIVTETVDDISWKEEPPPAARKAIGGVLEPLQLLSADKEGVYHLGASLLFKDSLFKAQIHVTPQGQVSLTDETLLIENMPVTDDSLGQ